MAQNIRKWVRYFVSLLLLFSLFLTGCEQAPGLEHLGGDMLDAVLEGTDGEAGNAAGQEKQTESENLSDPAENSQTAGTSETAEKSSAPEKPGTAEKSSIPEKPGTAEDSTPAEKPGTAEQNGQGLIEEDGIYDSKEEVALYLHTYDHLPRNYMTKAEARELGWSGGSLEEYAPGAVIGGDWFGNYEGLLPESDNREYHECDIDTLGKAERGAKRIIYSNDGLIYFTDDHYESFTMLYGEDET